VVSLSAKRAGDVVARLRLPPPGAGFLFLSGFKRRSNTVKTSAMLTSRNQNRYLRLGPLVFALIVLCRVTLSAESPYDELKSKLVQALEENASKIASDEKVASIGKLYLKRLEALKAEFIDQGSLDGVLEVRDEIRRFENSGGIPTEFSPIERLGEYQRIYANEIKKIESEERVGVLHYYNVYDDALLKREEELVRSGFIEGALDVREERVRVKKVIKKLSRGQAGPMTKKYFASHREQAANTAESAEDVFNRPGEAEALDPAGEKRKVGRGGGDPSNEAFDALKARFKELLKIHWEMVAADEEKMFKEYLKELRIREYHYQSQGSLDGVLALRAEIKRLEETGALLNRETELKHLEIVQNNFVRDLKKLKSADRERLLKIYRQHLDDMGELERSLVKKRLIDEAVVVRKERERVAKAITDLTKKDLVLSVLETNQNE